MCDHTICVSYNDILYGCWASDYEDYQGNLDLEDIIYQINKYTLSTETAKEVDKALGVKLLNDNNDIIYELYPFKQCKTITVKSLGYDESLLKELNYDVLYLDGCKNLEYSCKWKNGMTFDMNLDVTYRIKKNGKILSEFFDNVTYFQMGDEDTTIYLYDDKDLIIVNEGDVESMVIIKTFK